MRIILRRKVSSSIGSDAEQLVRSTLAHITGKIHLQNIEVKNEGQGDDFNKTQLITIEYGLQGIPDGTEDYQRLVRDAVSHHSDLEFVSMDVPHVHNFGRGQPALDPDSAEHWLGAHPVASRETSDKPQYYMPRVLHDARERMCMAKTTVKFSVAFHPEAVLDSKAKGVRSQLFNSVFDFVASPCLSHKELFHRNFRGHVVAIVCSLEFFTNKVDEAKLREHLEKTRAGIPGTGFIDNSIEIINVPVDVPSRMCLSQKPIKICQGFDAVSQQVCIESFFEADERAVQPRHFEAERYDRDAMGRIKVMSFDYAQPDIIVCNLAPQSKEQKLFEVSSVFFKAQLELSPKMWKKHPQSADSVQFVLFKSKDKAVAEKLKETLGAEGLYAYVKETPAGNTAVSVNLKK